jgi:hypothetical protein
MHVSGGSYVTDSETLVNSWTPTKPNTQLLPIALPSQPMKWRRQNIYPPGRWRKTIVVFGDDKYHVLVIPASRHLDLREAQQALGLRHIRLASEIELTALFPDCELGAMPPIGALYDLPTYPDSLPAYQDTIAFNGGTHRDAVHMPLSTKSPPPEWSRWSARSI